MPSINMIAIRRSEKKRFEANMRRLLVIILAEVVAGIILGGWFTVSMCNTRARIADLDIQLQKLRPTVRKIEDYEAATAKLRPKLELLEDAKTRTLRWRNMLAELSEVLPSDTWLTRLDTVVASGSDTTSGATMVSLNGLSASQNQIGETMLRLNAYPDFERVDLHYTQSAAVGERQAIEFEIAAALTQDNKAKEGASGDTGKS
ncbi:MAG: PilN domain-containing protein [Armatimonadota bacterium]|nr:PilN domain-containing protein [Armatimonadota bacterium]